MTGPAETRTGGTDVQAERTRAVAMSVEDAQEYSESLAQIGHGWWRQIAWAIRQRIPETLGLDRRTWGEKYHGYMQISIEERREAVAELAANGMSQREIADALGVGQATVARDLKPEPDESADESEGGPDLPVFDQPEPDESADEEPISEEEMQAIVAEAEAAQEELADHLRWEALDANDEAEREREREARPADAALSDFLTYSFHLVELDGDLICSSAIDGLWNEVPHRLSKLQNLLRRLEKEIHARHLG